MDVEQIRSDLRDVRIFVDRYFPFVVIPLSYMRIVASESVLTAGVDETGTLAINPTWWNGLEAEGNARRLDYLSPEDSTELSNQAALPD